MPTATVPADVIAFKRAQDHWGLGRRIAFRFVFVYSLLYFMPFPVGYIPGSEAVADWWDANLARIATPVGHALFGVTVVHESTGSGDTTLAFVLLFLYAAGAAVATLVWSIVDRRRPHYRALLEVLLVYVRFALATTMMSYGAVKVWKSQFPLPSAARLMEPVGAMSPMGLLWTFMGHSTAYTVFAGLGEILGGALLFVRRTALLGALIVAGVMSNVAMLNLAYDVPVKLYSLHLLGFALLVAAPHATRLVRFFVLGAAVPPDAPPGPRRLRVMGALLGFAIAAALTGFRVQHAKNSYLTFGDGAPRSPIEGIYEVDELVVDGAVVPPLLGETKRLRRVGFNRALMTTLTVGDDFERYLLKLDDSHTRLTVSERNGPPTSYYLTLTAGADGRLVLAWKFRGQELRATLRKLDDRAVPLRSRGFHWIQEQPYNR